MSARIDVRCIDGVDLSSLPLKRFDGANWEEAARALARTLR